MLILPIFFLFVLCRSQIWIDKLTHYFLRGYLGERLYIHQQLLLNKFSIPQILSNFNSPFSDLFLNIHFHSILKLLMPQGLSVQDAAEITHYLKASAEALSGLIKYELEPRNNTFDEKSTTFQLDCFSLENFNLVESKVIPPELKDILKSLCISYQKSFHKTVFVCMRLERLSSLNTYMSLLLLFTHSVSLLTFFVFFCFFLDLSQNYWTSMVES